VSIAPGTKVRFHGRFLKSTGQQAGGEGQKVFTVVECGCTACTDTAWPQVAVNERNVHYDEPDYFSAEEKAADPGLKHRHIAVCNLQPQDASGRWVQRAKYEP
jgi:hypothetical protein